MKYIGVSYSVVGCVLVVLGDPSYVSCAALQMYNNAWVRKRGYNLELY
jgi:hypothetical protein